MSKRGQRKEVIQREDGVWTDHPFLDPLRTVYRRLRGLWVGALHPMRRKGALRRIRALKGEGKILILCTGNICRSPYAEARLQERLGDVPGVEVLSAGLMGKDNPPPPDAQLAAKERGLELAPHRSRLLTRQVAAWADLIVVMDTRQKKQAVTRFGVPDERIIILSDLDPEPPQIREIVDPLGLPLEVFQDVYSQEDRCLAELIEALGVRS